MGEGLPAADSILLRAIDARMLESHARSGLWLSCRQGCSGCCIGPFPITWIDAARLERGWRELAARCPETAARILDRARDAAADMRPGFPGDWESGNLDEAAAEDALYRKPFLNLPCPVLDLETGACQLYEHRPIACRTYGPAIVLEGERKPHCRLNYCGATPHQIEACRVDVDPRREGERLLAEFLRAGGRVGQTLIAIALRDVEP